MGGAGSWSWGYGLTEVQLVSTFDFVSNLPGLKFRLGTEAANREFIETGTGAAALHVPYIQN